MTTPNRMTARLGGAFLLDSYPDNEEGRVSRYDFASWFGNIGYVFIDLPDGTRMQLFYNNETRLFCADIISADETHGNEFVRTTVPTLPAAAPR